MDDLGLEMDQEDQLNPGVILACLKLFDWGATFFRSDLVARLEGGAFGLPPQLDDFYADLTKKLDADTFVPRFWRIKISKVAPITSRSYRRVEGKT